MFYDGKSVLVTGGSGFVGTHIVQELLKTGAKIRVSVHNSPLNIKDTRIETMYADLTKSQDCMEVLKGIDYVFHAAGAVAAAGVTVKSPMKVIVTNLILTAQILQAAWAAKVKRILIFGSSTGYPAVNYPIKEEEMWNGPTHPTYFGYGWMRRYLERIGEFVGLKSDVKVAIVRPTAIYGPWDNFEPDTGHVIPALIRRALEKEDPYVVWGTGDEVRDFLFASDLARGCLLMLEKCATCEPINIGYGKGVTIKEVVNIILKTTNHTKAKVIFDSSKPTTIAFRMVDTSKAKRLMGFEPRISLEEGLRDTVKWYLSQAQASKINPSKRVAGRKRKVLVCGATGFIGRNVAERLIENNDFEVYGTYLDSIPWINPKIQMIRVDLRNKSEVDKATKGMDVVIQAAATTSGAKDIITKPYYHVTDNAMMNALLFRAAYEHKISHFIFFSCTIMYQSSDSAVKETDFNPNEEIYPTYFGGGWTKVYNEKMCEFYSRIGPTKYTVIRHSNIYGPYDKFDLEKSHVFGATVTKIMTAEEGQEIGVWGQGNEERDLLYVSDLVDFIVIALDRQDTKFDIYNVGYGNAISINNLVKKLIHYSGKDIRIKYDLSKPSIKTKLFLDITKATNAFGWSPKISIDEGIKKTLGWYKEHIDLVKARVC